MWSSPPPPPHNQKKAYPNPPEGRELYYGKTLNRSSPSLWENRSGLLLCAPEYPPLRKGRLGGDDILNCMTNLCHVVIPSSASPFQGEDTSLSFPEPLLARSRYAASPQQLKNYSVTMSLKISSKTAGNLQQRKNYSVTLLCCFPNNWTLFIFI